MKSYQFKKIDAFTKGLSSGNPAACIYLNNKEDITEEEMQRIARELRGFVNEVVYLFPEKDGPFLRYYSAECEVDFCGHGTVAAMYDYIGSRPDLLKMKTLTIRVKDERLAVYNRIEREDSVYIMAPVPRYSSAKTSAAEIGAALGIDRDRVGSPLGPTLINAGLNTFIVPVDALDAVLSMAPDLEMLKTFCLDNGFDIVLVYNGPGINRRYRTRVFAPKYGYLEDPATGSGNSAFGYYLLKAGLWDGSPISIEQNGSRDFPNIVKLSTTGEGTSTRVVFGGAAMVKIKGEYLLPA